MFHTPVTLTSPLSKINLKHPVLTAGSCFADCMGLKFEEHKFSILANPFGTVYNPLSLQKQYLQAIKNIDISHKGIANTQGLFFHYDYHSMFKGKSEAEVLKAITKQQEKVHNFLKTAEWFIITWGTAWVYEKNLETVANCHKQPQKLFDKKLLEEKVVIEEFDVFIRKLKEYNPSIKIILTISPVRHIRDTLTLNMVSKSILRVAAHKIAEQHPEVYYFPAYEIMMDELRDYRFYKEDMIHPTPQAEDYIWKRFKEVCIDAETQEFISNWREIRKSISHKAFNPSSEAHQQFLRKTLIKLEHLKNQVDISAEKQQIMNQLL